MQGSILCSAALGFCTLAICALSVPALGENGYILAAVLIIIGVILAKLGIDVICDNAQKQEKMTVQIISELESTKNNLTTDINVVKTMLEGQEKYFIQTINELHETCNNNFEKLEEGLNKVNMLIKEQKQDFDSINSIVCEKAEAVLGKIQKEEECVNKEFNTLQVLFSKLSEEQKNAVDSVCQKISGEHNFAEINNKTVIERLDNLDLKLDNNKENINSKIDQCSLNISGAIQESEEAINKVETLVQGVDKENIKNIKLLEQQLIKNKDFLESINQRLRAIDDLISNIEKCKKELKTQRENFDDFTDDMDEQCSKLNDSIEGAIESFREQNKLHRQQLEDMQKRYTSLSEKDMELINKLLEDVD